MLFDYRKAFDFIDHCILIEERLKFSIGTSNSNKLAKGCYPSGDQFPPGYQTKLGPWLFILFIFRQKWKTASEKIEKGNFSNAQGLTDQSLSGLVQIELSLILISAKRCVFVLPAIPSVLMIDGKELEVVPLTIVWHGTPCKWDHMYYAIRPWRHLVD